MTTENTIEKRLEKLGLAIGRDESIVENVMGRINQSARAEELKNKLLFRRFIMNRFSKIAAAAAIILIVVLGITFFCLSPFRAYAPYSNRRSPPSLASWLHYRVNLFLA